MAPPNSGVGGIWLSNRDAVYSLPITGWKLWIWTPERGAFTVNSRERKWTDAPREGIQVLCVYHPGGRKTFSNGDGYCIPGESEEKLGTLIPLEEFERIYRESRADTWRPE